MINTVEKTSQLFLKKVTIVTIHRRNVKVDVWEKCYLLEFIFFWLSVHSRVFRESKLVKCIVINPSFSIANKDPSYHPLATAEVTFSFFFPPRCFSLASTWASLFKLTCRIHLPLSVARSWWKEDFLAVKFTTSKKNLEKSIFQSKQECSVVEIIFSP